MALLAALPELDIALQPGRIVRGALAGLLGGLVFGAMMASAGMLAMVAMLVGGRGDAVGWPLHLALSASFGGAFAVGLRPGAATRGLALGVAWGLVLWAVAAMVVMRLWLGAPIALDTMARQSLAGHVAFGAILGVAYALFPASFGTLRGRREAAKVGMGPEG